MTLALLPRRRDIRPVHLRGKVAHGSSVYPPEAVTHCVDLVTGLVSAENVGEFGAARNNVVLGGDPTLKVLLPVLAS